MAGSVLAASLAVAAPAAAQGPVEVTISPGGGFFFTEGTAGFEPDFSSYSLAGSVTYNATRLIGFEGELGGAIGVDQRLDLIDDPFGSARPPNMLTFTGNVLYYPATNERQLVPYVTGGLGGLTVFERQAVGVSDTETFFTGNFGGGVKYHFGRWGVRGDYRAFAVRAKDDAPAFFGGDDTRWGHRVAGSFLINLGS
jgi:opacity protein-like surface antigen